MLTVFYLGINMNDCNEIDKYWVSKLDGRHCMDKMFGSKN